MVEKIERKSARVVVYYTFNTFICLTLVNIIIGYVVSCFMFLTVLLYPGLVNSCVTILTLKIKVKICGCSLESH